MYHKKTSIVKTIILSIVFMPVILLIFIITLITSFFDRDYPYDL